MNQLDEKKKINFSLPFTFWQQLALGLALHTIGYKLSVILGMAFYHMIFNGLYWSLFLVNPVLPEGCPENTKKLLQITALCCIFYPVIEHFFLQDLFAELFSTTTEMV